MNPTKHVNAMYFKFHILKFGIGRIKVVFFLVFFRVSTFQLYGCNPLMMVSPFVIFFSQPLKILL